MSIVYSKELFNEIRTNLSMNGTEVVDSIRDYTLQCLYCTSLKYSSVLLLFTTKDLPPDYQLTEPTFSLSVNWNAQTESSVLSMLMMIQLRTVHKMIRQFLRLKCHMRKILAGTCLQAGIYLICLCEILLVRNMSSRYR